MVLHDLNQACRYADYLVAVKEGRVFAQGEPMQVMTEAIVSEVFGLEPHYSRSGRWNTDVRSSRP